MTSLTKNRKPRTKKNVFFSLQTQRLVESFKGLNSFLAQSLVEIFPRNDLCKLLDFSLNHLAPKVLRVSEKKRLYKCLVVNSILVRVGYMKNKVRLVED